MGVEHGRTELVIPNDARLIRAVATVVEHAARRAGLPAAAQREFALAAEQACLKTFPLVNGRESTVTLAVEDFDDRIEVTLEHSGRPHPPPAAAAYRDGSGEARGGGGEPVCASADRVLSETREGRSRLVLIKYLRNGSTAEE